MQDSSHASKPIKRTLYVNKLHYPADQVAPLTKRVHRFVIPADCWRPGAEAWSEWNRTSKEGNMVTLTRMAVETILMALQTKTYVPPKDQDEMTNTTAAVQNPNNDSEENDDEPSTPASVRDSLGDFSSVDSDENETGSKRNRENVSDDRGRRHKKAKSETTSLPDDQTSFLGDIVEPSLRFVDRGAASNRDDQSEPTSSPARGKNGNDSPKKKKAPKKTKDPTENPENWRRRMHYVFKNPETGATTTRPRFHMFVSPLVRQKNESIIGTFTAANWVGVEITLIIEDPEFDLADQMARLVNENKKNFTKMEKYADDPGKKKRFFSSKVRSITYTTNDDACGNLATGYETMIDLGKVTSIFYALFGCNDGLQFGAAECSDAALAEHIRNHIMPFLSEEVFLHKCEELKVCEEQRAPLQMEYQRGVSYIEDAYAPPDDRGMCLGFQNPAMVCRIPVSDSMITDLMQTKFWWITMRDLIMRTERVVSIDTFRDDFPNEEYNARLLSMATDNQVEKNSDDIQDHYFIQMQQVFGRRVDDIRRQLMWAKAVGDEAAVESNEARFRALKEQMQTTLDMGMDETQMIPDSVKSLLKFKESYGTAFFYHDIITLNLSLFGNMLARLLKSIHHHGALAMSGHMVIMFVVSSMHTFDDSNGKNRFHVFVRGSPGSGKSYAASVFKKLLDEGMYTDEGYTSSKVIYSHEAWRRDNIIQIQDELKTEYMKSQDKLNNTERENANTHQTAMASQKISVARTQKLERPGAGTKYIAEKIVLSAHYVFVLLSNHKIQNQAILDRVHEHHPEDVAWMTTLTIADYSMAAKYESDEINMGRLSEEFKTMHLGALYYHKAVTLKLVPPLNLRPICEPPIRILFEVLKRHGVSVKERVRAMDRIIVVAEGLQLLYGVYFLGSELSPLRVRDEGSKTPKFDGKRFNSAEVIDTIRRVVSAPNEEVAIAAIMMILEEFVDKRSSDINQALLSILCGFHLPYVVEWVRYVDYMEAILEAVGKLKGIDKTNLTQPADTDGSQSEADRRKYKKSSKLVIETTLPFDECDTMDPSYAAFAIHPDVGPLKFMEDVIEKEKQAYQETLRTANNTVSETERANAIMRHASAVKGTRSEVDYGLVPIDWSYIHRSGRGNKVPFEPENFFFTPKMASSHSVLKFREVTIETTQDGKSVTTTKLDPTYIMIHIDKGKNAKAPDAKTIADRLVRSRNKFKLETGIAFDSFPEEAVADYIESLEKMDEIAVYDIPLQPNLDEISLAKLLRPAFLKTLKVKTKPVLVEHDGNKYINIFVAKFNIASVQADFERSMAHKGTRERRVVLPMPNRHGLDLYNTMDLKPRNVGLKLMNPRYLTDPERQMFLDDEFSNTPYSAPESNERFFEISGSTEEYYAEKIDPWIDGFTYDPEYMPERIQKRLEELYKTEYPYSTRYEKVREFVYPDTIIQAKRESDED